jgi:hypothetical protein
LIYFIKKLLLIINPLSFQMNKKFLLLSLFFIQFLNASSIIDASDDDDGVVFHNDAVVSPTIPNINNYGFQLNKQPLYPHGFNPKTFAPTIIRVPNAISWHHDFDFNANRNDYVKSPPINGNHYNHYGVSAASITMGVGLGVLMNRLIIHDEVDIQPNPNDDDNYYINRSRTIYKLTVEKDKAYEAFHSYDIFTNHMMDTIQSSDSYRLLTNEQAKKDFIRNHKDYQKRVSKRDQLGAQLLKAQIALDDYTWRDLDKNPNLKQMEDELKNNKNHN